MSKKIVVATGNKDKMREVHEILDNPELEIVSMKDEGIDIDIVEDGESFVENALIKARAVASYLSERKSNISEEVEYIVIADDSGLCIDALDGGPGIFSARFMGENASYKEKNAELIKRLEGVPDDKRSAHFTCAIAAVLPNGKELSVEAQMHGRIWHQEEGPNGFGYDPIFYLPEYGCTNATLKPADKNAISHRGKALRLMKAELEKEDALK